MIQINPLKSYIDGGVRAALTTPPSASLVFDLPGKAIWVKGVKLKGTDHTYTFSHDNYITLTNTPDSNESEDIKIGVNTSALKSAIDTTYGVVSTAANGLAPKFTSGNKQAAAAATTYYFLGWAGSTLKWYQAPFRNIRINSETTDCLGVNNTDPLIIGSGNGISVTWDSTNKKIIITNTKPDINHNTDTKVAQSVTTQNKNYAIILKGNDSDEGSITTVNFSTYLKFNPSTKQLTINGNKVITTIDTFVGATTSADGSVGLVTKPLIANRLQFLRGDGTWATPIDTWRPVKVEGTEKLGSNALDLSAGNGISIVYNSNTKKIIITNTKPDVNHNTHYTTMLYIGENNDTKANKNVANPYLKLFDDNTRRATFQIKAGSGIAIASDANGNITITNSSPDVNHNTDITVKQTPKTDNINRPLMMINGSTSTGEQINTSMFSTGIYANASTKMITANGFIKAGSSDSYILLGGGGHKAISDFATSGHNHDGRYVRAFGTSNDNIDSDWGQSFKTFDPIPLGTPPEQNPNISLLSIGNDFNRRKQLAFMYNNDNIYYRRRTETGFSAWKKLAFTSDIPTVTNYYWANVKVSSSSSTSTSPIFGKVGIGTTSIRGLLDLGSLYTGYDGGGHYIEGTNTKNHLRIQQGDSSFSNYSSIHLIPKYVGINKSNPSHTLDVAGDIYTTIGFKKEGSSDSYVLLGGGGHKAISDFATASHTHIDTFKIVDEPNYINLSFRDSALSKKASEKYIECWDSAGGWWNWAANKWIKAGSNDSYVLLGGGGHKQESSLSVANADTIDGYHASWFKQSWTARIQGNSWSRLYQGTQSTLHHVSIFSVEGSIGCVVFSGTFLVQSNHSTSAQIICLANGNYTQPQMRVLVNSSGDVLVDMYWVGNDCNTSSSSQQMNVIVHCLPLKGGINQCTSFTNDSAIPSGYSVAHSYGLESNTSVFRRLKCTDNIYAPNFYSTSDIRFKNIEEELIVDVKQLSKLPLFNFTWNNGIDGKYSGTSAQEVIKILPNLVSGNKTLTLNYAVLGTIAGITACKELVTQKSELQELKEKVKQLEDKLRKYENTL